MRAIKAIDNILQSEKKDISVGPDLDSSICENPGVVARVPVVIGCASSGHKSGDGLGILGVEPRCGRIGHGQSLTGFPILENIVYERKGL
jgi:hypothetical protein